MRQGRTTISVPDYVARLVQSLHPHIKKKIRAAFQALIDDPFAGKSLKDECAGLRSFRVGRHRVIYRVPQKDRLEIVAVGSRESIYEETYRLLQGRSAGK